MDLDIFFWVIATFASGALGWYIPDLGLTETWQEIVGLIAGVFVIACVLALVRSML